MKIARVILSAGKTGFFFDDQRAIKRGARHDGFIYEGQPVTPGFRRIREAGESVSVILILEDGQMAVGDCAAVQYSGAGGRDPLFLASSYIPIIQRHLVPLLAGMSVAPFREMAARVESLRVDGAPLHTAIRYGVSQALLHARALEQRKMMCEVLCDEYTLPVVAGRIPIFAQSGDDRYSNVDKMILKRADVLPHGLINNVDEKLGRSGEKLAEYIRWLSARILKVRDSEDYRPALHIDVYGTIGIAFGYDYERICDYMASLEKETGGLDLYIEGPVDVDEKAGQIEALGRITQGLARRGSRVKVVADEWCNTYEDVRDFCEAKACHMVQIKTPDLGGVQNIVESVLHCKAHGMEAYQGGTCNETDVSARVCVHLAYAARAERILAKPGMGFDEGYCITNNEMERITAVLNGRAV